MDDKYKPNKEAQKIVGFFHGIDTATQNDYYTDVVHVLTEKPKVVSQTHERFSWNPYLCGILRLKKMEPNLMIDTQIKYFNKFPPFRATIDSSREEFLVNALIRKYGETVIQPTKFLNAGSVNVKFDLKQIGYSYLHAGYAFPDDSVVEQKMPRFAKLIRILKKEMVHEQVEYTNNGRITFNEPSNKHNDLVHGWELSLKGVMEFQQKNLGYELRNPKHSEFAHSMDEIYKDYPTGDEDDGSDSVMEKMSRGSSSLPF